MHINRREAVIRMAVLTSATIVGPRFLSRAFGSSRKPTAGYSAAELALLDEVADTIIPPTGVPGAKAAEVGAFIAMMVNDCYEAGDRAAVRTGLAQLNADYSAHYGGPFTAGNATDRTAFLKKLDRNRPRYFRIVKELTLLGYFTSEIGCTQALQYAEAPGRYDSDAPYRAGERDWADSIK